jgi:hypothetical protein
MGSTSGRFAGKLTADAALTFEFGTEILADVVESALKDGTVYAAVRTQDGTRVRGLVVLTERQGGELRTTALWEEVGSFKFACPRKVLDRLTPTTSEHALAWRESCRANLGGRGGGKA